MKKPEDELTKAKEKAYRLLGCRQRSREEMAGKLSGKGFSPRVVESVLKDLERSGYIDDARFARDFVELKLSTNPAGRKYFESELRKKRVSEEIISGVLDELLPGDSEFEIACNLALKRMSRYSGLDPESKWKKVYGYLGRKGFRPGVIRRIYETGNIAVSAEDSD